MFVIRIIYINVKILLVKSCNGFVITSPPIGGGRGIVMPMSVCLFVCVFVCVCVCLFVRVFAKLMIAFCKITDYIFYLCSTFLINWSKQC